MSNTLDDRLMTFIRTFTEQHNYAPTLREMAAGAGVSTLTVQKRLLALREAGAVNWVDRVARSVRVVDPQPEADPFGGHVGQWLDVDGEAYHFLAAPDMSDDTKAALGEIVRATKRKISESTEDAGDGRGI